jgi:glucuronoarabinoxylan endo-1,4-beta-xylanase
VNPSITYQTIEGFGASDACLPILTDAEADLFFSQTNGIGLTFLRNVMGDNGTTDNGNWVNEQKAIARGATVWASTWSPPAAYKSNNDITNGGYLLPEDYSAWASLYVAYVQDAAQNGVPIYGISIQNEPDFVAPWASCTYTGQQMTDFIKVPGRQLYGSGISPQSMILFGETSGWSDLWSYTSAVEADPVAVSYVGRYATHQYAGVDAPQTQARAIWETETATFDGFDPSIGNGLVIAQQVHDALVTGGATAWHYWNFLGRKSDNEGLIGHDVLTDRAQASDPTLTKRLYTVGNFSKFVRPGFIRIDAGPAPSDVLISAYIDPASGSPVIVAINNGSDATVGVFFNGKARGSVTPWVTSAASDLAPQPSVPVSGNRVEVTLSAQSVTTLVRGP